LNGIVLGNPSTQRPATVTGRVSNKNADAIYGKPVARWTVANRGTIESTGSAGFGIDLAAGGTVSNGDSGAAAALIAGYGGVAIRRRPARSAISPRSRQPAAGATASSWKPAGRSPTATPMRPRRGSAPAGTR
jgi:hypothetical protein